MLRSQSSNFTSLTTESDTWSLEEIEAYHQALMKCDKDFYTISKTIGTKSVKQCIQFYYLWKKVCGDEYKRLRIIRRKREQEELYNLRSKAAQDQASQRDEKEGTPSPKPGSDLVSWTSTIRVAPLCWLLQVAPHMIVANVSRTLGRYLPRPE